GGEEVLEAEEIEDIELAGLIAVGVAALVLVGAHVHDPHEARQTGEIGGDPGGHSAVVAGVDAWGSGAEAEVAGGGVEPEGVGVDVAVARTDPAALDVAVGYVG